MFEMPRFQELEWLLLLVPRDNLCHQN